MKNVVPSPTSILIALGLQAAVTVWIGGSASIAIWLGTLPVAGFVWLWTRKRSRVLVVFLNALILTLPVPHGWGGDGSGTNAPAGGDRGTKPTGGGAAIVADQTFPGII